MGKMNYVLILFLICLFSASLLGPFCVDAKKNRRLQFGDEESSSSSSSTSSPGGNDIPEEEQEIQDRLERKKR